MKNKTEGDRPYKALQNKLKKLKNNINIEKKLWLQQKDATDDDMNPRLIS